MASTATSGPVSAAQMPTPRSMGHGLQLRRVGSADGSDNAPIVVVVGWMGAKESQLKNYVNFYNSHGISTLSFAVGPMHVLNPSRAMSHMQRVLDQVKDISQEPVVQNKTSQPRPVIFHCFSMGEAYRLFIVVVKFLRSYNHVFRRVFVWTNSPSHAEQFRFVRSSEKYDQGPDF